MKTEIYRRDNYLEAHATIGDYSMLLELWHTDDFAMEEANLHGKETYYYNEVQTTELPEHIKEAFEEFSQEMWESYESPYFPTR